ncbi:MAG TPA: cyclase family protein [Pirellulales bacterium]|nr:cyclase family protein [Pirellulales bacterium]
MLRVAGFASLGALLLFAGTRLSGGAGQRASDRANDTAAESTVVLDQKVRAVDLTHRFDEQNVYWPTEIPFHLERGPFGVTPGGWFYSANRFRTAEHSGTHIDAPIHFSKDAHTVDQVPLDRLMGPGALIDVSGACRQDADYLVTIADFEAWEERHRRRLDERIVLVRTGWAQFWPDRAKYLGTAETGKEAVAKLHFPGIDPAAATWLVEKRHIRAIAIDTASIDRGQSPNFATHVVLCSHNTPAFENVADLAELPATGFTVVALPMKIAGGSGGPLRIVALVPQK